MGRASKLLKKFALKAGYNYETLKKNWKNIDAKTKGEYRKFIENYLEKSIK